ncbi:MAG: carboxylesterase family protein [Clostridia bacterium]|nr:carboxylesterase family protein [Clostridia bacterium]
MEVVHTLQGRVRGLYENGMWVYRGIPFAQSPEGERRFMPPLPVFFHDGIMDATRDGMRPWQKPAPWVTDAHEHTYGEDCLNLNIWTPAADGAKRPVLVYFFGGGHFEGSNCEQGLVAQPLLKDENCVMVTPNYRVGALGYLYLGHLLGEKYALSGNLGLLDQIAALKWVRDNISRFGGDPDQVTIMGQSAGAKSVACLLASPMAQGLYRRAILMSGGLQCIKDIQTEKALTRNFLQAAGLGEEQAAQLLNLPVEKIRDAQEKANEVYFKAESYGATADGLVIAEDFEAELRRRRLDGVQILMGHTLQELFLRPDADKSPLSDEAMQQRMVWKFGDNAGHVMEKYRMILEEKGFEQAWGQTMTNYTYVQAYQRTARLFADCGAQVFLYRWDAPGAPVASHTSDLETLFDMRSDILPDAASRLKRIFTQFIRTGTPQLDEPWDACTHDSLPQMQLGQQAHMQRLENGVDDTFPLQVMKLGE